MQTTSTVAPRNVRLVSWPVSSRTPDLLGTFRGEVAEEDLDADRGARIKSLRDALGLTQPEAVDLLTEIGGEGPTGPYVTARQYQRWEQGATLTRRRAKVLAQAFGTSTQFIFTGEGERRTPSKDPVTVDRLDGELENRIGQIETTLNQLVAGYQQILAVLSEARHEQDRISELVQTAVAQASGEREQIAAALGTQTQILSEIQDATRHADDAAGRLDEAVARAGRALRAGTPGPAPTAAKPVSSRTRRASTQDPS